MLLTLKPSSTKLLLPMQPESHCSPGESGQEGNKGMFSHSKASGSRQPEPRAPLLTQSLSGEEKKPTADVLIDSCHKVKVLLLGAAKAKDRVTFEVTHFQIYVMAPWSPMTPTIIFCSL